MKHRRHWSPAAIALIATMAVATSVLAAPGNITLASTSDDNVKSNGWNRSPSMSADGTRVTFSSEATNLDPGDADETLDVYVKDLVTGDITLASTSDEGTKGNALSGDPSLSADGTKVAFHSHATNFDPGDTEPLTTDVYVKDLITGDIALASTSDAGLTGNGDSSGPSLSADGTKVAFVSDATNLDPGDTDTTTDVYVKDLISGDITLVSTTNAGAKANDRNTIPSLSADGRKVAFSSLATNLDPRDTDSLFDVYVKDLATGDLTLASTSDSGEKGNHNSASVSLSGEGSRVAFTSVATNLDPADADRLSDVYVKDLVTGDITLASTSDDGMKGNGAKFDTSLSADGNKVAFQSFGSDLDPSDSRRDPDIYVKDLVTGDISLASTSDSGGKGNADSSEPAISANGLFVAFASLATNLDVADTDTNLDVYVKELGASADLSVIMRDSRDPTVVGRNLTYTITVSNSGPETGTAVTLTDELPTGAVFVSATSDQGDCSGNGGIVTCDLGSLADGERVTARIVIRPTEPGTLRNIVQVSANEADPDGANNIATETTVVN